MIPKTLSRSCNDILATTSLIFLIKQRRISSSSIIYGVSSEDLSSVLVILCFLVSFFRDQIEFIIVPRLLWPTVCSIYVLLTTNSQRLSRLNLIIFYTICIGFIFNYLTMLITYRKRICSIESSWAFDIGRQPPPDSRAAYLEDNLDMLDWAARRPRPVYGSNA